MYALVNCKIFTGEAFLDRHAVIIENKTIVRVCNESCVGEITKHDCGGAMLLPGFIDLQVNGGGGILFNDEPTKEAIQKMLCAHQAYGTACICPTFITDSTEKLAQALSSVDETDEVSIPAVHIEGFFISQAKSGIHNKSFILSPTHENLRKILNNGRRKKIITVAPETFINAGDNDFVLLNELKEAGCIIFGGHTDASYECFEAFLKCGGVGATHLFNAMSQFTSREPGVCGAVFDDDKAVAGIVADGRHVHFSCVRTAKRIMGERLFLVTDAMTPACSDIKEYTLYGENVYIKDGVCVSENGVIAGSCLSMLQAVKNCIEQCVCSPSEAFRMASLYPARIIQRNDLGMIAEGCAACITVTDEALSSAKAFYG